MRTPLLTSSILVTLLPALLAPRCHFGSDDVPLGSNQDAGAGMGGSAATSGSAGMATAGSGGSDAIPGSGGVGGGTPIYEPPCLEQLSALEDGRAWSLEFGTEDVLRLLSGTHRAPLTFAGGGSTGVSFFLVAPEVFYVESEHNPNFPLDIDVTCENHVRVRGYGRLLTDDGQLDESFPELELNITIPTLDGPGPAADRLEAEVARWLDRTEIRGSYDPPIPATNCLLSLQFELTVSRNEFAGTLIDMVSSTPCDSSEPSVAVTPRDIGSWSCLDGACRSAAEPAVVLDAASCAGLGVQVSGAGDEASFEREVSALSREESWGGGCPGFPEFVLAYTPSSPIELRLCHDDGADPCEAALSGVLLYDLGPAFARAGTTDYRFVD